MRCTALLRRGFALLRPRMSGAGVAFPVRFFSVHFRCDALLCTSSPKHYLAFLLQSITWLFFSKALLCHSSLFRCDALPFFSFPARRAAYPARYCAFLLPSVAQNFLSKALQCISNPTHRMTFLFRSIAVRIQSSALRVQALPQLCGLLHILRVALPCGSYPRHFIALHCPTLPLPSNTLPMPCTAFLLRSHA